jgi:hypothetical protein
MRDGHISDAAHSAERPLDYSCQIKSSTAHGVPARVWCALVEGSKLGQRERLSTKATFGSRPDEQAGLASELRDGGLPCGKWFGLLLYAAICQ